MNDSVSAEHARKHHGGRTTVIAMLATIGITISLSAATLGTHTATAAEQQPLATDILQQLPVSERASKSGYQRTQFGPAWLDMDHNDCDTRNDILKRDLTNITYRSNTHNCVVASGHLNDPYTGKQIDFVRGNTTSTAVQIDHVVALSDSWQTGAQNLSFLEREDFANDPYNLLAVDGPANQEKSDNDASQWLPSNTGYRCSYVARQIGVKQKYSLWVTQSEKSAMENVLSSCPAQQIPADSHDITLSNDSQSMYRLYNKYTGEHFYTASVKERDTLRSIGWNYEGTGWQAPVFTGAPVYRLYNKYVAGGDHHYTTNVSERDDLVKLGWICEGAGWYSAGSVPVYRQYNPYARTGTHNYTTSKTENDALVGQGWHTEDIGWQAVGAGHTVAPQPSKPADPKPSQPSQPSTPAQPAQPSQPSAPSASVHYKNCTEVRKAGKAPLHRGDPGYEPRLDRDNDGVACETK